MCGRMEWTSQAQKGLSVLRLRSSLVSSLWRLCSLWSEQKHSLSLSLFPFFITSKTSESSPSSLAARSSSPPRGPEVMAAANSTAWSPSYTFFLLQHLLPGDQKAVAIDSQTPGSAPHSKSSWCLYPTARHSLSWYLPYVSLVDSCVDAYVRLWEALRIM